MSSNENQYDEEKCIVVWKRKWTCAVCGHEEMSYVESFGKGTCYPGHSMGKGYMNGKSVWLCCQRLYGSPGGCISRDHVRSIDMYDTPVVLPFKLVYNGTVSREIMRRVVSKVEEKVDGIVDVSKSYLRVRLWESARSKEDLTKK